MKFVLGYDRWEQFRFRDVDDPTAAPSQGYATKDAALAAIAVLDPDAEIIDKTLSGPVRPPA